MYRENVSQTLLVLVVATIPRVVELSLVASSTSSSISFLALTFNYFILFFTYIFFEIQLKIKESYLLCVECTFKLGILCPRLVYGWIVNEFDVACLNFLLAATLLPLPQLLVVVMILFLAMPKELPSSLETELVFSKSTETLRDSVSSILPLWLLFKLETRLPMELFSGDFFTCNVFVVVPA